MSLRGFFAVFVLCALCAGVALAQPVPATCDPDYKDVMDARAWLGATRDMESAQRIIRKPDSVLEYSCFEFTNNFPLVIEPLHEYLDTNFGHIYLGGAFAGEDAGICNPMAQVWFAAKCQNHDFVFQTFEDMAGEDLRTLPEPCALAGRQALIEAAIDAANPPPGEDGALDEAVTYLDLLEGCGMDAIPTGVIITDSGGGGDVKDAVCLAPGCHHDGEGGCE